jgi:cell division protein FtsL
MAATKQKKRRAQGKTPPTFQRKRKKTFSEKAIMVLGIIIALSMILALISNFGAGGGF